MHSENVTKGMDLIEWLNGHWGMIGAAIAVIIKFAQDHLRIRNLEDRVDKMEESQKEQLEVLYRLDTKTDVLIKGQETNTEDIKRIHRGG